MKIHSCGIQKPETLKTRHAAERGSPGDGIRCLTLLATPTTSRNGMFVSGQARELTAPDLGSPLAICELAYANLQVDKFMRWTAANLY